MSHEVVEKYQVAGLDERERGFSRLLEMECVDGGYRAVLRYESTRVETGPKETSAQALEDIVVSLRARGYRQLRTRLNFRRAEYLGSREPWVEYPDPEQLAEGPQACDAGQLARRTGWIRRVLSMVIGHDR